MIIMIDLDSTIINTSKSIINLHNKLNPDDKIEYIENHDWNFSPMVTKEQLPKLFKLFDNEDFYDDSTLVVYENVIEIINKLSIDNEVIICSKHENSRRPISRKWISETFPNVQLVFTDSFDKSIIGHVNLAIDDKPEALASIDSDYKILYGFYDWNKGYTDLRVTNWKELSYMIKIINTTININKNLEGDTVK